MQTGRSRVETSLANAVRRGKLSEEARAVTLGRIRFTWEPDALVDRQLVVEAVPELESLKIETFWMIDKSVTDPDAVLASNTSSIPIMKLAMATGAGVRASDGSARACRPDRARHGDGRRSVDV